MNFIPKIALLMLPPALQAVLEGALVEDMGLQVTPHAGTVDAVICAETSKADGLDLATPVLTLEKKSKPRLQTLLRQIEQMVEDPSLFLDELPFAQARFSPSERKIRLKNEDEIELTDKEANILVLLLQAQGRSIPRQELLERVWRYQPNTETHTVETHIYRLRQKLDGYAELKDCLQTDAKGYGLKLPSSALPADLPTA